MARPTMRRMQASGTTAGERTAAQVGTSVMPVVHGWLDADAVNCRQT